MELFPRPLRMVVASLYDQRKPVSLVFVNLSREKERVRQRDTVDGMKSFARVDNILERPVGGRDAGEWEWLERLDAIVHVVDGEA